MALTPLKQRPATAYRRIPVPNGSILLVPNNAPEPAPPGPSIPTPTAQWDVNTRGRTDDDFYEHQAGVLATSVGAPPVVTGQGGYSALDYNGSSQYTAPPFPAAFTSGICNSDFTLSMRIAVDVPSVDFELWAGWGNNLDANVRVTLNTGVDNDTKASFVGDNGTPQWFGNPDPDAPQDGSESVVTFRRSGTELSIWKDGVQVHVDPAASVDVVTANVFEIAAQDTAGVPKWHYDGKVFWVAVWDSALTDEEVGLLDDSENPFGLPSPPPAQQVSWNPGWYMLLRESESRNTPESRTQRRAYFDAIAAETAIKGVVLKVPWIDIEDLLGVYETSWLADEVAYLASLAEPKRLWIRIEDGTGTSLPAHIWQDVNRQCKVNGGTTTSWRRWETTVVTDFVNMLTALAAELDHLEYFEGITLIKETALGGTVDSGQNYTSANYIAGMDQIAAGAKAAFTQSNVVSNVNTLSNPISPFDETIETMIANNAARFVGQGGPDVSPQCTNNDGVNGTLLPNGFDAGDVWGNGEGIRAYQYFGGGQYNGQIPVAMSIESTNLGSVQLSEYTGYSWEIFKAFLWDEMKASHVFVQRKDFLYGQGARDWLWSASEGVGADDYLLPYIQTNPEFPAASKTYPYPT